MKTDLKTSILIFNKKIKYLQDSIICMFRRRHFRNSFNYFKVHGLNSSPWLINRSFIYESVVFLFRLALFKDSKNSDLWIKLNYSTFLRINSRQIDKTLYRQTIFKLVLLFFYESVYSLQ